MTATDELRRMLDERGLTYVECEDHTTIYYDKDGSRYTYSVEPKSGWAQLFGYHITPEKAIAATVPDAASTYAALLQESAARMALQRDYNNQIKRIQNQRKQLKEMQAALERGKCHMVLKDDHEAYGEAFYIWWECDECGCTLPNPHSMPEIRYCPNCGRRVVE